MRKAVGSVLIGALYLPGLCAAAAEETRTPSLAWKDCLRQKPAWYGSAEAVRIADNVLLYQRDAGGWAKNIDMAAPLGEKEKADLAARKKRPYSTIDNGATHTQLAYLARVFSAAKQERFREGFLKGMDFLLKAQYENGGWPQIYPKPSGYHAHITFNDNAMIDVMRLLRDVARKDAAYAFVDEDRRLKAEKAVQKGVECILECQVVVAGKRTAWCAQHDEKTLRPADARSFEKASLSGGESVNIVRFLMSIDKPGPEVIEAVQSAVAWFDQVKLTGIRQVEKPDPALPEGHDKVIVQDAAAGPLWARFYEIGTNRPIFCGRDGVIKYNLAEIEHERRIGYSWYGDKPAGLLAKDYPAWQAKWAPGKNVLARQHSVAPETRGATARRIPAGSSSARPRGDRVGRLGSRAPSEAQKKPPVPEEPGARVGKPLYAETRRTFSAFGPFGPCVTSNSTSSPSASVLNPSPWMLV